MNKFRNEMHVPSKFRRLSFHQDLNVSFLCKWRLFRGHNSDFYALSVVFLACLERPPNFLYEFGWTLFL